MYCDETNIIFSFEDIQNVSPTLNFGKITKGIYFDLVFEIMSFKNALPKVFNNNNRSGKLVPSPLHITQVILMVYVSCTFRIANSICIKFMISICLSS